MTDPTPDPVERARRPITRLINWLEKQRLSHLDMVTDAGDASLWCRDEADLIADFQKCLRDLLAHHETAVAQAREEGRRAGLEEAARLAWEPSAMVA